MKSNNLLIENMKICIDAGHNYKGADTGAEGNNLKEQDITFPIADKVRILLEKQGINVIMTRGSLDTSLGATVNESINKRVQISNSNNCDYFVSIHCNAGGGTGTETLVYCKGGIAEKLANYVQDSVVSSLGLRNRGVKEQNVGVLRLTAAPAILVETAFIDNYSDSLFLLNNIDEFAKAIAGGIFNYLGIKPAEELTAGQMKAAIAEICEFSNPAGVWEIMDKHPFAFDLYKKWHNSYR